MNHVLCGGINARPPPKRWLLSLGGYSVGVENVGMDAREGMGPILFAYTLGDF